MDGNRFAALSFGNAPCPGRRTGRRRTESGAVDVLGVERPGRSGSRGSCPWGPVVRHLRKYADPGLAEKLKGFKGKISYEYDWRINEP